MKIQIIHYGGFIAGIRQLPLHFNRLISSHSRAEAAV